MIFGKRRTWIERQSENRTFAGYFLSSFQPFDYAQGRRQRESSGFENKWDPATFNDARRLKV
jgi:hypothetical protein